MTCFRGVIIMFSVFLIFGVVLLNGIFAVPSVDSEENLEEYLIENVTSISHEIEAINTGLRKFQGRQYTFHATPLSWVESVLYCWRQGAQLAVAHSTEEAQALADLLIANAADIDDSATMQDAIHVAVHRLGSLPFWTTVDGLLLSETGYDLWIEGGEGRCVAMFADGRYLQQTCSTSLAFVCESASPRNELIAENYTLIPEIGRFRLHDSPLAWPQARRRCEEEGATLAVPTSGRAAGLLAGVMLWPASPATRANGCFVGITDIAKEGDWITVKGRLTSSGYNSWRRMEPSGNRSENCAVLMEDGLYVDHPCLSPLAFCCEIPVVDLSGNSTNVLSADGYQFHTEPLTWFDAVVACHKENMSLAFPRDQTEENVLIQLIQKAFERNGDDYYNTFESMHIGIHNLNADNEWLSVKDDVILSFASSTRQFSRRNRKSHNVVSYRYRFYSSQDNPEYHCAGLRRNSYYQTSDCFSTRVYACE